LFRLDKLLRFRAVSDVTALKSDFRFTSGEVGPCPIIAAFDKG